MRFGRWKAEYRPHGWVRLREDESGPRVYLQFDRTGPAGDVRYDLKTVVVRAEGDALTARTLRRIPFSQLEQDMRRDVVQAALMPWPWVAPEPSMDSLDEYIDTRPRDEDHDAIWGICGLLGPSALVSDATESEPATRGPIVRKPAGGRITDEFLTDVAEAYRYLTSLNRNPAPDIAAMSGAPVATARRWIYESRKRGILPPGRPGRAG